MDKTEEETIRSLEEGEEVEVILSDENSTSTNEESPTSATEEAAEVVAEAMAQMHQMELKTLADAIRVITSLMGEIKTMHSEMTSNVSESRRMLELANDQYAEAVEVTDALKTIADEVEENNESPNFEETEQIVTLPGIVETSETKTKTSWTQGLKSIL